MSQTPQKLSPAAIAKRHIGQLAATLIEPGMRVGLGTGSTAAEMVHALGARWRDEGLRFEATGTSAATEEIARIYEIPVVPLAADMPLDLYLDGADQIDAVGNLIKGHGGALLREKLVAAAATRHIIMVDVSKYSPLLGVDMELPVEVVRFGEDTTRARIEALGCKATLRMAGNQPFMTDERHYIYNCTFAHGIADAAEMARAIKGVLGVVETGLFIDYCDAVLVGSAAGAELVELPKWKDHIEAFLR